MFFSSAFTGGVYVKTTVEGIHKRLPDCDPIRSINSHQMIWMAKFFFLASIMEII